MTSPFSPIDPLTVNATVARRVLKTVDAGLVGGLGNRSLGGMCVEAAVCYAYSLPHGDRPPCVHNCVRQFKISLNDAAWTSDKARAKGLRQIAIAQLGSLSVDPTAFLNVIVKGMIQKILPLAIRAAANHKGNKAHRPALLAAARACSLEGTGAAAIAAAAALRASAGDYNSNRPVRYLTTSSAHNCACEIINAQTCGNYNTAANNLASAAARAHSALTSATGKPGNTALILAAKLGVEALKAAKSQGCKYLYLTQKSRTTKKKGR